MELLKYGFDAVYSDFQSALSSIDLLKENEIVLMYKKLEVARKHTKLLEEIAFNKTQLSIDNQIVYYKNIRPEIYKYVIFFEKLLQIHSLMPLGSFRAKRIYINQHLKTLESFYHKNKALIQYLRLNLSNNDAIIFSEDSLQKEIASAYHASEMLEDYLHKLKHNLLNISSNEILLSGPKSLPKLSWTGSKTALIELIYALAYSGHLNNGQAGASAIAQAFEHIFCVDLKDYRKRFQEIKIRKEPDKFLQLLSFGLKSGIEKQLEL